MSGTFDLFDVICKQFHRVAVNPFLNGTKNSDVDSKGLFTPNESERESEKDQRTIGRDQKNKQQTSKKIFAFAFAFAWCGQAFSV